jgi:hypothetical protein
MCTSKIIAAIMTAGLTAGCVSVHPEVDERYGDTVRAAKQAQILNPQPARYPQAGYGVDGRAAKEAMDRYVDSFKAPPPTMNVINIGGSLTSQEAGSR